MRYLYRLNAEKGSGKRAEVPGYRVGGKTGTAEKVVNGRYSSDKRFNAFVGVVPDGRSAVHRPVDRRRTEAGKAGHGRDGGLECGADRRQHHPPFRRDAWREAGFRP